MIVKSGREYILENGFNDGNGDKEPTITKIIFGDSDDVSEEENDKESLGNKIISSETNLESEDNYYYYEKDENGKDKKINEDGTDASIKTKDACNFECKKDEDKSTTFLFKIRLNRCKDKEDPKKISCMGLFHDDILIARVVFPPIYKKNETELNLDYTLYF